MMARWSLRAEGDSLVSTLVRDGFPTLRAVAAGVNADVAGQALELRRQIQDHLHGRGGRDLEALRRRSRTLFAQICPPGIREALAECEGQVLLVDADEAPGGIPWEFLHNGRDHLALAHVLAREIALPQSPPAGCEEARRKMVIIADPAGDLENAWYEGDRLLELLTAGFPGLRGSIEFRSGDVSPDWVREHIWDAGCMHYAGHLEAGGRGDSAAAALVLGGGEDLSIESIIASAGGRSLPAVMVLHSCGPDAHAAAPAVSETLGPDRMAEALLSAGTRALVSASVMLPDAPVSSQMMEVFYRSLLEGRTVGDALRGARQAVRDSYPELLFSCAHVLYGDPCFRLPAAVASRGSAKPGSPSGDAEGREASAVSIREGEVSCNETASSGGSTQFSFSQCRHSGCFRALDPGKMSDPFNACCDAHALTTEQKRNEARRLQSAGSLVTWLPREEVCRCVLSYLESVTARMRVMAFGDRGEVRVRIDGSLYNLRVDGEPVWTPLPGATSLATRLRLMGDPRHADHFPQEGALEFRFRLSRKGKLRTERRDYRCRTLISPDLEALLGDDLLWRPMSAASAQRAIARMRVEDDRLMPQAKGKPGGREERFEALATPLGAADAGGAKLCVQICSTHHGGSLAAGPRSGEIRGRVPDEWESAALSVVSGLMAARSDPDLLDALRAEMAVNEDVLLQEFAGRAAVPAWYAGLMAEELARKSEARITHLEDGVVYVNRMV